MKMPSMPIPMGRVKDFDQGSPKLSFERWSGEILAMAKNVLCHDGYHSPMAFFVMSDGETLGVTLSEWMEDNESKNLFASFMHQAAAATELYGVAMITEAWAYKGRGKDDHVVKQLQCGEISVSELNPEDREEILMVHVQSREGMNRLTSVTFTKDDMVDPEGNVISNVVLGEETTVDGENQGRFSGLWRAA